ncbi:MAG TPA: hypothetical protein VHB79_04210 [Polyangiaceae bacterium]|nr:hypothetical protein [Polyangiaceae bacterium]
MSQSLERLFHSRVVPGSLLEGKTRLRDATASLLQCSQLEAENIVETLVARGFARFHQRPDASSGAAWVLQVSS